MRRYRYCRECRSTPPTPGCPECGDSEPMSLEEIRDIEEERAEYLHDLSRDEPWEDISDA